MKQAVESDKVPRPIGPYSVGVAAGELVFVSGQGPTDPGTGHVEKEDVKEATRRTLENVKAILETAGVTMAHVVKCNVYLLDMKNFPLMNEVYKTFFAAPYPARTTIQAAGLPNGIPVEIECIAHR